MINDRLRRVTDLFIEGAELYFGQDDEGQPVLVWVNKLNSFEIEEARRDGATKRGMRLAELTRPDNPELIALQATMATWDADKLAEMRVEQMGDEIYLGVINDLDSDPEWRQKLDLIRRGPQLLSDEGADSADERYQQIAAAQTEYVDAVRQGQSRRQLEALDDVKQNSRQTNIDDYLQNWRDWASRDVFMQERRVSELFAALRDCKGALKSREDDGTLLFDHADCDHSLRLLKDRAAVYKLPEAVIERAVDAIDGVTVPPREAGNSDAPASSSASLERSTEEEAVSTPSIPVEMPLDAPTT